MANTSVAIKNAAGAAVNVDGFTAPDGDLRQAVVLGDAATAQTATIAGGALAVSVANTSLPVSVANATPLNVSVTNTALPVSVASTLTVDDLRPGNASGTQYTPATTASVLIAASPTRIGLTIFNGSTTATLYIRLGTVVPTATNYTVRILPGGYYEMPYRYTGEVRVLASVAGGGGVMVTEIY